jgi:peptidoglycan/xylan/chitin deacetylase (PgdA/CDA1 family)
MGGDRGIVVAFHRVNDTIPEDSLTRSSRDFDRFCRFFKANYDVISLDEFIRRLSSGASLAGALAITFDDGYLDNYEVAAPILYRLGLPSTFFVVTQFLGTNVVPWWDASLVRQPGWMTWDQVRSLRDQGFDIGAHTQTHVDLGQVNGAEAEREICGSREDLKTMLGVPPRHFAYPYGGIKNILEANRERTRSGGFASCVSCHGGTAPPGTDPFRLRRIPLTTWFRTPEQFAFEVSTSRE